MTAAPRAIVAGAGIGGLAAAAGLRRGGWQVQVLERRTADEAAAQPGAGISLWPNGLHALAALGVSEEVLAGATLAGGSGVRTPEGRWIARTDIGDAVRDRFGLPLVITTRQRLIAALAGALGPDRVEYGCPADAVDPESGTVRCGGRSLTADLVVVADGARSRLRSGVLAAGAVPRLRYAGYTSWRFTAPRPGGQAEPAETWGRDGQRFAVLPLGAGEVYCYATAACPAGGHADDERAELRARFSGWHDPVPALLAGLPPGAVIRTDISYLSDPPASYHRGRTVLLGDAAHAMTPDLGQGGCQALEDAATLAALLPAACDAAPGGTGRALAGYSRLRAPRAGAVARRSARAGRLYQAPLWLRGLAARASGALPASVTVRALDPVVSWEPPVPPEAR